MGMAPRANASMKTEVRKPICDEENESAVFRPSWTMGMSDMATLLATMKSIRQRASRSAPRPSSR
jgi:hypothetical protein